MLAQRDAQWRERRWHRWTAPVGALGRHRTQPEAASASQPHRRRCIHQMVDTKRRKKTKIIETQLISQSVSPDCTQDSPRHICMRICVRRRWDRMRERETYVFVRVRTSCSDATDNSTACAIFLGNSAVRAWTCARTYMDRGTREAKAMHISVREQEKCTCVSQDVIIGSQRDAALNWEYLLCSWCAAIPIKVPRAGHRLQ